MKHIKLTTLIFGLLLFGCNQADNKRTSITEEKATTSTDDKEQIQNLIRQVLNWSDSKYTIDLLPVLTDSKDSVYIGFDLDKHKQNLDKLQQTNFFATEFIENYNQIILTLDQGIRNGNYDQWLVGDLPTFIFANDHSPWCNCQDNDDWNKVEVRVIKLTDNEGELEWTWGNLSADTHSSWKEFAYKFRVVKENDKWKIVYLTGFDFKESTRKDGQL
ncbi:MAG: hypothetical protein K9I36_13100 [Bacteroidia bacterium]|nr:hypothetical protein [Bacteroidia bacterium]